MSSEPTSKEWRQTQRAAFFSLVQYMAVDPGRQTPEWNHKEASFLASLSESTNVNEFLPAVPSSLSRTSSRGGGFGSRIRATTPPSEESPPPTPSPSASPSSSSNLFAHLPQRKSQTFGKDAWSRSAARPKPQIRERSGASAPSTTIGLGHARQNTAQMKEKFFSFLQSLADDDIPVPSDQKTLEDLFFQSLKVSFPTDPQSSRKEIIEHLLNPPPLSSSTELPAGSISGDSLFDMLCNLQPTSNSSTPPSDQLPEEPDSPDLDSNNAEPSAGDGEDDEHTGTPPSSPGAQHARTARVRARGRVNRASIRFISDLANQIDSEGKKEAHPDSSSVSDPTLEASSSSPTEDYDSLAYAHCIYSYEALRPDEISICRDDFVRVISTTTSSPNWWLVELRGKQGIAPSNYVQIVDSLPSGEIATALLAHHPSDNATGQYLEFDAGDIIQIVREEDSGWIYGYFNFHQGLVPRALLYIPEPADAAPLTAEPSEGVRQSIFAMKPMNPQTPSASTLILKSAEEELAELILALDAQMIAELVGAIDIASVETLAKNITKILVSANRGYDVLECLIQNEINRTTTVGTLFRSNSVASHFMVQLARIYCTDYFKLVLFPCIDKVCTSGRGFEIDPDKAANRMDVPPNMDNLQSTCQMFFDRITKNTSYLHPLIRKIAACLVTNISTKFPEEPKAKYIVIAGFIFLRLCVPVVVSPEMFGYIPPKRFSDEGRRGLMLISKILQCLGNQVLFGKKEDYLIPFNPFLRRHTELCHSFFDEVAMLTPECSKTLVPPSAFTFTSEEYDVVMKNLARLLASHSNQIRNILPDATFQNLQSVLSRVQTKSVTTAEKTSARDPCIDYEGAIGREVRTGISKRRQWRIEWGLMIKEDPNIYFYSEKPKGKVKNTVDSSGTDPTLPVKAIDVRLIKSIAPKSFNPDENPLYEFSIKTAKNSTQLCCEFENLMWAWIKAVSDARTKYSAVPISSSRNSKSKKK